MLLDRFLVARVERSHVRPYWWKEAVVVRRKAKDIGPDTDKATDSLAW